VESNGSLPAGGWLQVTWWLTACTSGLAPGPALGNQYGRTLTLPLHFENTTCLMGNTVVVFENDIEF